MAFLSIFEPYGALFLVLETSCKQNRFAFITKDLRKIISMKVECCSLWFLRIIQFVDCKVCPMPEVIMTFPLHTILKKNLAVCLETSTPVICFSCTTQNQGVRQYSLQVDALSGAF